jgi:hypothetical protein
MTISPEPPHAPLDPEDTAYVRRYYCTLEAACFGREEGVDEVAAAIVAGELPRASYEVDGQPMVPFDYFTLCDSASSSSNLRSCFVQRYTALGRRHGVAPPQLEKDAADAWKGYQEGGYGICLWSVTPENIFLKGQCMDKISALLQSPVPDDPEWRRALRIWVDRLDALERPFARADRARFGGSVSRDRLINGPRERFPAVFA